MNKGYGRKELLEYLLKVGANVPWLERFIFRPAKFLVVLVYIDSHWVVVSISRYGMIKKFMLQKTAETYPPGN